MAVVNNEALSFTNMSSATIYQYRGTSKLATQDWWLGYYNSNANHNLCIKFTPSTTLSKVVFTLTSYSYKQDGSKPCYYQLTTTSSNPGLTALNKNGTSFTFTNKIATITLEQAFQEGTDYYLWIGPTSGDGNFGALFKTSAIECETQLSGLVYIDNGTEFVACQIFIDNGSSWDQYIPYIDNGTDWDMCT